MDWLTAMVMKLFVVGGMRVAECFHRCWIFVVLSISEVAAGLGIGEGVLSLYVRVWVCRSLGEMFPEVTRYGKGGYIQTLEFHAKRYDFTYEN